MANRRSASSGRPPAGRRSLWRLLGIAYLTLLVLSHVVRWRAPSPPPRLAPGQQAASISPVWPSATPESPPGAGSAAARVAWREWGEVGSDALPALLLHGSPGSHRDFESVAPALASERLLVAPDLPGFGASQRDVDDYSIRAHAAYVAGLLDRLERTRGIERLHVVGFSMGGGVALELYRSAPERFASLSLLGSIGVQEHELLGDYHLNHAVHALQLAFFTLLGEGTPHFGTLDDLMLDRAYCRNFFDTDQRPLRGILRGFEPPMLIVHGEDDFLVPAAAAREHHRLVPQSELAMLATDHFFLFRGEEEPIRRLASFWRRIDRGGGVTRSDAAPDRRIVAARPFDPASLPPWQGFTLAIILCLLALATLVSEDLTTIGAGLLVSQGRLGFVAASAACFAGIYVGDLLLFLAGRLFGRPALAAPPLSWWISRDAVDRSSAWFDERGPMVIFLSRFLPGTRLATYFAAGALEVRFWRFAGWFLLAAAVWTPMLVGLSVLVGREALADAAGRPGRWIFAFAVVVLTLLVLRRVVLPLFTWAGRRRLLGGWRRWTRWEFWPPWLFYPPVVLWVGWLGLKHRSLTLFTAANPAIPAGGFVGESKAAILDGLGGAADVLPRWRRLPAELTRDEAVAAVETFLAEEGLELPVVLKPDVGQRGLAVEIVHRPEQLAAVLADRAGHWLVQEYVAGQEFGVFYVRRPGEARGRIISVTEKRLPSVVGDGVRTIEQLVLADERAVALADLYLERVVARRVPAAGEEVPLAVLGTHCRGAVFLDGGAHLTEALEAAIDQVSRTFTGFYFGRYDLRTPSVEALRSGGPFKILELNGVTSEATHIYDPRHGLLAAYRTLARQWALAFEIGARLRERGVEPTPLGELVRSLRALFGRRR